LQIPAVIASLHITVGPGLGKTMRRRHFIKAIAGAATAWPLAALARQSPMRRVGVLMNIADNDSEAPGRIAALQSGLRDLGWIEGQNLQIDYRWAAGDVGRFQRYAVELVALGPDVILASASPAVSAIQQTSHTVPIVFVNVIDPVGAGFVASLAKPGGNTTGFTLFEYSISGKWLEMLKQIAPRTKRVGVIRDRYATGIGQYAVLQAMAPTFGVELRPIDSEAADEIEGAIAAVAAVPDSALIVTLSTYTAIHRDVIVAAATRHRLAATYGAKYFVDAGGLLSYGPDTEDGYRRAASYIDRILHGEKPADLPVQAPTKYELAINLKTAKSLGVNIPPTLLATANEVIE
jgi:putative tryptophan/tyrosine transport system substrate-binding protein